MIDTDHAIVVDLQASRFARDFTARFNLSIYNLLHALDALIRTLTASLYVCNIRAIAF